MECDRVLSTVLIYLTTSCVCCYVVISLPRDALYVLGGYLVFCYVWQKYRQVIRIKLLYPDSIEPKRSTSGSVGYDLFAYESVDIQPHQHAKIKTGIAVQPPDGTFFKIETRSSYAIKNLACNGGIIDNDYIDELHVVMYNLNKSPYSIKKGEKVAQMILYKVELLDMVKVDTLSETSRKGGFGSTGN
jgi:dUTP pyrophosphatase